MKIRSLPTALAIAGVALLALAGCSAPASSVATNGATLRVVASTNVYGDIASRIGGKDVQVTSIMSDPAQDPHSFEASAQNQLAISKADILIENGGGYDDFMDTMRKAAPAAKRTVLNVVDLSGKKQGDSLNEHVWYDFPTMKTFADSLAAALGKADAAHKAVFQKNAATFDSALAALEQREADLKQKYSGQGVAITEPVPLYMLQAIGLQNKTPQAFSEAVEAGTDVSPAVLKQTLDVITGGSVRLLAYNEQTSGPETQQVLDAANQAGVAVVPVRETLPPGKDYLSWMNANLDAVSSALAR